MERRKNLILIPLGFLLLGTSTCNFDTQEDKDRKVVQAQQAQYAIGQPVPVYDWSLERDLVIQLYNLRNERVVTHAVWRSDYGKVEFDCPSMGYGIPYDTSLTNPWQAEHGHNYSTTSIGQAEPNGVFASTNTSATWIMCVEDGGILRPVYVEAKVTVYPWPMDVNYDTDRVTPAGKATVSMEISK